MLINFKHEKKLSAEKNKLKKLRSSLKKSSIAHQNEIILLVNTLIGRINCELTDDDLTLEMLAKKDKIHE